MEQTTILPKDTYHNAKKTQDVELMQYRKKQELLYNLKRKYSLLLELNKSKRQEWILTNIVKKRILFEIWNLTNEEINEIPSIYRYRCYLYEPNDDELLNFNLMFDQHIDAINNETDSQIKKILLESFTDTKNLEFIQLIKSNRTQKIPIMLDLRIYGKEPTLPVVFGDKIFYLDDITKKHIKSSYEKINPLSIIGERFSQMIQHSKIIRDSYQKEINEQRNLSNKKHGVAK